MKYNNVKITQEEEKYLDDLTQKVNKDYGLNIDWYDIEFYQSSKPINTIIEKIVKKVIDSICESLDYDLEAYLKRELYNRIRTNSVDSSIDLFDLEQYSLNSDDRKKVEKLKDLL